MMDFLRRLAPPREGDRSRAVAVLASRFARDLPLRSAAVPGDKTSRPEDSPAQAPEPSRALRSQATTPQPQAVHATPRRPESLVSDNAAPALRKARAALARTALTLEAAPIDRPMPQVPADVILAPPRVHFANAKEAQIAQVPRASTAAPANPAATASPIRSAAVPTHAAPLSRQAIDARVQPVAARPPVIHVTIDRIDIRAPAAPARPAVPARPQPVAPSVSLTDYLRGDSRIPRGGTG